MNKENITKGEFKAKNLGVYGNDYNRIANTLIMNFERDKRGKLIDCLEGPANAELIAETFNVFTETNQTPRELMEANKELLDAMVKSNEMLKDTSKVVDGPQYGLLDIIARNRDLIKKHSTK